MLLSLDKDFIFIHVPKTAGSSVTRLLQPWCVEPERSQFRRLLSHLPVREDPARAYLRQHDKAEWARRKLKGDFYDRAFKFATVRNPYDFAVSYFHYVKKSRSKRRHAEAQGWDFAAFLAYLDRKRRFGGVDQMSWIADGSGTLIVDKVMRFETLDRDFAEVLETIGLPPDLALPRINRTVRSDYRGYYDEASMALVRRLFGRDIEQFGYTF